MIGSRSSSRKYASAFRLTSCWLPPAPARAAGVVDERPAQHVTRAGRDHVERPLAAPLPGMAGGAGAAATIVAGGVLLGSGTSAVAVGCSAR